MSRLAKVADVDAHEGPVWLDGALYFTSLPRHERPGHPVVDIRRLDLDTGEVTTVRADANAANGMTLAPDGRLLVCEQGTLATPARIGAVDPATGEAETVVDALAGLPLNSPNDVVVKRDGTIWFTDPGYGFLQGFTDPPFGLTDPAGSALGFSGVYRVRPGGEVELLTDELAGPNGLAFTPDERWLYVGNWDFDRIVVMRYDPETGEGSVFFDMTAPDAEDAIDGLKVDTDGNLYVCGPGGVWVLSPDGDHLGTLHLPEAPHNLAWGGDGHDLYITALTSVYRLRLRTTGVTP